MGGINTILGGGEGVSTLPVPNIMDITRDATRIVITGMEAMGSGGTSIEEMWQSQIDGIANFQKVDDTSYTLFDSFRSALQQAANHPLLRHGLSGEEAEAAVRLMLEDPKYFPSAIRGTVSHNGKKINDAGYVDMIKARMQGSAFSDEYAQAMGQTVYKGKFDPSMLQALHMSLGALKQADLLGDTGTTYKDPTINFGHGFAGLRNIERGGIFEGMIEAKKRSLGTTYLVSALPNMPAPFVANILQSRNAATTDDNACAAGIYAMAQAVEKILAGRTQVAIAGGNDGVGDSAFALAAFGRMGALARGYNDMPSEGSRPFSQPTGEGTKGFVLGDGGAVFTLETMKHAQERGVTPLAEIRGIGLSNCNPIHEVPRRPLSSGTVEGQALCMQQALDMAGITAEEFKSHGGVVLEHGTATEAGDTTAAESVHRVFGDDIQVTATKSATGHALGGAGPQSAALGIKMMEDSIIAGTLHYNEETRMDGLPDGFKVVGKNTQQKIKYILVNAFGFGGHNASMLLENPNY